MDHKFDAKRIAHLASLSLNETEASSLNQQVDKILAAIDKMQTIDTTNIEPLINPLDYNTPLREDEVTETDQRDTLQKLAPKVSAGLYIVPQVIASANEDK